VPFTKDAGAISGGREHSATVSSSAAIVERPETYRPRQCGSCTGGHQGSRVSGCTPGKHKTATARRSVSQSIQMRGLQYRIAVKTHIAQPWSSVMIHRTLGRRGPSSPNAVPWLKWRRIAPAVLSRSWLVAASRVRAGGKTGSSKRLDEFIHWFNKAARPVWTARGSRSIRA